MKKKQILELKLEQVSTILEKKNAIKMQLYEKAADLREKEREMAQSLNEKKLVLLDNQMKFQRKTENLEEFYLLLSCLNEIAICHTPEIHFTETLEEFYTALKVEYLELFKLKKECFKNHQFKQAGEINEQIMKIGNFLKK